MHHRAVPLTESELNRLEALLDHIRPGHAMTLPEVDGYLCALLCGPNNESMDDRLRHVVGEDLSNGLPIFSIEGQIKEATALLTHHWNAIAATLMAGKPYLPIFDVDDEGRPQGKEWADGFARGMKRDPFKWDRFLRDKNNAGITSLLALLVAESNPDLVRGGIGPIIPHEKRPELLAAMVASLTQCFRYFQRGYRLA